MAVTDLQAKVGHGLASEVGLVGLVDSKLTQKEERGRGQKEVGELFFPR
jgi:hypothetical protein